MWLFSADGLKGFFIVFCLVTRCHGGVIPAVIAGGVAAPAAFMLFRALANSGKESGSTTSTTTSTTTTVGPRIYNDDFRSYDRERFYRSDRDSQFDYIDNRQRYRPNMYETPRDGHRPRPDRDGMAHQPSSSSNVYNSYTINNNNNLNNVGNSKTISRVANNVVANLQFVTKNMQPPSFRLPSLEPSRSASTTIMVNGAVLTQGSSYAILGDRAFLIQHLDVHMPPQYKYPSVSDIVVDITVTDENNGYRSQANFNKRNRNEQRVSVLFNGEKIRDEFALVLQNKTIPPGNIFMKVNGNIVLGDISLDAITFPSSDKVGTEFPPTGTAVFQMNGGPIEPYTFSVEIEENAAPVEGITVTDMRGRPLTGLVDIEVVEENERIPHAITLVNGKDSRTTYSILVKGIQVPANDLIFKVNGQPQSVIVDFAVSEEVITELEESSHRVAVVPSRKVNEAVYTRKRQSSRQSSYSSRSSRSSNWF